MSPRIQTHIAGFGFSFPEIRKERSPMPSSPRVIPLILLVALCLFASWASPAPQFSGNYKIIETTDLGADVRIGVELKLLNVGDTAATITAVSIRSLSSPHQMVRAATNLTVQAHADGQLSVELLMPKKDFGTWAMGPHQQFILNFHSADGSSGKPIVANVLLSRAKG
jgi:hypothetical protein